MQQEHADHREVGRKLDLFHQRPQAPGMVFWHAPGFELFERLVAAARDVLRSQDYREVRTPQLLKEEVWQASGHADHFAEGMIRAAESGEGGIRPGALKPVSCPGHLLIVQHRPPSYRELPMRLAEFGVVHRNEASGALQGLLRLRQFTQDDGHILCADAASAREEIRRFCQALPRFYAAFGFEDLEVALATRPADRAGSDAAWDEAEAALADALADLGLKPRIEAGGGAFYGPKIEYTLRDGLGRKWQCGTIQFDLHMPARFDVAFIDANDQRRVPLMLHRALFGSLERFLAVLLEHHGVWLPAWLAPCQAVVAPIGAGQRAYAEELREALTQQGIRVLLDDDGTLGRRIARARELGVPHVLVVGAREVAEESVALRDRAGNRSCSRDEALAHIVEACARPELTSVA